MRRLANYLIPNISQREREISDFNLIQVIEKIDHSHSKIGQQYLCYKVFNSIRIEDKVGVKDKEIVLQENLFPAYKRALNKLNKEYNFRLADIVFGENLLPSHWSFKYSKFLLFLLIASFFGFRYNPTFSVLLISFILIINSIIFFISKGVTIYSKFYLFNLLDFSETCETLNKIDNSLTFKSKSLKNPFFLRVLTFQDNIETANPFGFLAISIVEVIKAFFLVDSIIIDLLKSNMKIDNEKMKEDYFTIANVDLKLSLYTLKNKEGNLICNPEFCTDDNLSLINFSHPLIDDCVVNSIDINNKIIMVSGSNLAGKSTFLKAIAVNIVLGRALSICFAKYAKLNNINIYSSFKISDDLLNAKSFFNVELDVIKNIITNSDKESIVFLDEPFKGTNSDERIALNISVLKYIYNKGSKLLMTTHDVKLYDYLKDISVPYHFNLTIDNNDVFFDYKVKGGMIKNYYAIRILKEKDFPKSIIEESNKLLKNLKK